MDNFLQFTPTRKKAVEKMDKKEYLRSYRLQQIKILRLKQMLQQLPENKRIYKAQIKNCILICKDIEEKINNLDNEIYKEVLIQKYICGKTYEQIALILNYSTRHIDRLHRAAIQKLKI